LTIAHTRGSPRLYASSARSSASPSILSVFARRPVLADPGGRTAASHGLKAALENGFVFLSPARRKRDIGAAVVNGDRM
jgi:hypothetical protein